MDLLTGFSLIHIVEMWLMAHISIVRWSVVTIIVETTNEYVMPTVQIFGIKVSTNALIINW